MGEAKVRTFDFTFPVVVEDGRNLTIRWNKIDDRQQVAQNFALQHGIPEEEVSTINAFMDHASSMCGETDESIEVVATKETSAEDEAMKDAMDQFEMLDLGDIHMETSKAEPQ